MSETNYKNLSVCIITRDQSEKLKKCLSAVKEHLPEAEIVVTDTGSRDDSMKIAREYTKNVNVFPWCDDFAMAKNDAVMMASNDLILILDTDEYIESMLGDIKVLIAQHEKYPDAIGRIRRTSTFINEQGYKVNYEEWVNRLFDRRVFMYEGCIHEQLIKKDSNNKTDYKTYKTTIHIFHDGYDLSEEDKQKKAERNIKLIKKAISENGEDPYLYYQLGKTYYSVKKKEEAAENLLWALELKPDPNMEYLSDLIELTGYALIGTGHADLGLEIADRYRNDLRYSSDADFMFMYAMLLMNNERFDEAVETFISCTVLDDSGTEGTASYMAWYNAGVISEVRGDFLKAREYYKKAGDFSDAREGIKRCGA